MEIKSCVQLDAEYFRLAAVGHQSSKYYELVLDKKELQELAESSVREKTAGQLTAQALQHFLQHEVLQIEERFSSSRALGSVKVIPFPHQIEAVYSRMLQVLQVRFLLADDPGAGKTIMAGMLIRELMARQSIERVLILVPPLVLKQWQDELKEKFNLDFVIINRYTLRAKRSNPFLENDLCLTSMYWAAKDEIKPFVCEGSYDLLVVDEAHKMAAYTRGKIRRRIARTKLYQLGEILMRKTKHCLLLTATPHKGDVENFRHLLSLLDHDIFLILLPNRLCGKKATFLLSGG